MASRKHERVNRSIRGTEHARGEGDPRDKPATRLVLIDLRVERPALDGVGVEAFVVEEQRIRDHEGAGMTRSDPLHFEDDLEIAALGRYFLEGRGLNDAVDVHCGSPGPGATRILLQDGSPSRVSAHLVLKEEQEQGLLVAGPACRLQYLPTVAEFAGKVVLGSTEGTLFGSPQRRCWDGVTPSLIDTYDVPPP